MCSEIKWKKMLGLMLTAVLAFVVLMSSEAFAAYQRTADNTVPAYTDRNLSNRQGNERVDRGDVVTVFEETDNAYYVRYPTPRGTKDRWVPKNIFNDSSPQPSGDVSSRQQAMADTARRYLGSGDYNGYCQRFVRVVGQNIGLPAGNASSALDAYNKWRVSNDRNIPVGATVYLRGRRQGTNGYKYGHVGIYIGNGNVIHALTTVREQSLNDMLNTFDYLGWGWQAGVDLR